MLLAPLFVLAVVYYSPERDWLRKAALVIFAFACLTDALDGYIARKFNQETLFGQYIDPIADKLLLLGGFLSMTLAPLPADMRIPAWVTTAVLTRDVVILTGSAVVFFATHSLTPEPSKIGKTTTFFQMITLVAFLAKSSDMTRHVLCATTLALTAASGIQYIRMGARLMQQQESKADGV